MKLLCRELGWIYDVINGKENKLYIGINQMEYSRGFPVDCNVIWEVTLTYE